MITYFINSKSPVFSASGSNWAISDEYRHGKNYHVDDEQNLSAEAEIHIFFEDPTEMEQFPATGRVWATDARKEQLSSISTDEL